MRTYLLLLVIPFCFFSCKKESYEKYSFSGVLLHSVTKQPIVNELIRFQVWEKTIGPSDIEFPNGMPIYKHSNFDARTDLNGQFSIDFRKKGEWYFSLDLVNKVYMINPTVRQAKIIYGNPLADPELLGQIYDTLYAEKPGYIQYHIKNVNNAHSDDTLVLTAERSTYKDPLFTFHNPNWPTTPAYVLITLDRGLNKVFTGEAIDHIIMDTLPAEFDASVPVKWYYKRQDTIIKKSEVITLSPHSSATYHINY